MKIEIEEKDFLDLIYWARRYCDRRRSYAVSDFNTIYDKYKDHLKHDNKDVTLYEAGKYWPFAVDLDWPDKTPKIKVVE